MLTKKTHEDRREEMIIIKNKLYYCLSNTRNEPGLPLVEIAETMTEVFSPAELKNIFSEIENQEKNGEGFPDLTQEEFIKTRDKEYYKED